VKAASIVRTIPEVVCCGEVEKNGTMPARHAEAREVERFCPAIVGRNRSIGQGVHQYKGRERECEENCALVMDGMNRMEGEIARPERQRGHKNRQLGDASEGLSRWSRLAKSLNSTRKSENQCGTTRSWEETGLDWARLKQH
jgi:hypothetical protein